MSARRFFVSALLLAATACRCDHEDVTITAADGISLAIWVPDIEPYFDRAEALEAKTILIPWTEQSVTRLREAASGRELELIVGLDPARTLEDEWNRPTDTTAIERALDRILPLGEELDGVHLDHLEVGLPNAELAAYLDSAIAAIRARTEVPISYAIRRRTIPVQKIMEAGFPAPPPGTAIEELDSTEDALAWANAWSELLADRVDRVVVAGATANDADSIELFANKLAGRAELWAIVDLINDVRGAISRAPTARNLDEATGAINVLRSRGARVLAGGAAWFEPEGLLGADAKMREEPLDIDNSDLAARAIDVEQRLRRCCIRDGQIVPVYDHRYERDHGDNLYQEDACWLTGLYAAAMSFQYGVTGRLEAAERAREAWGALHQMANTTPLKGEVVRSYSRVLYGLQPDAPAPGSETIKRWRRAEDRELYWVGDVSVDQLSGWFFGVAAFHDLVATEDEKREIAADVSAVLDIFLANDLAMIEFTGQPTTYGNLRSSPVLALAFFQIGFHVTADARYRAELERLIDQEGMHFQIGSTLALYHQAGRFGSDHFYSSGFYPLIMYETDPSRRAQLELGLEIFHTFKRRFGDAYADTVYGVFHPTFDAQKRAYKELLGYQPSFLENANYLEAVPEPHPGPFVPISARPAAELDFDYAPPGVKNIRGGFEHRFTGVGFLLSHWMMHYHALTTLSF